MNKNRYSFEQINIVKHLLYWALLIVPVSLVVGSLVALFLWLLEVVTVFRWAHLWIIFLLPPAGLLMAFVYKNYGKNSEAGNNLIIDEIHKPGGGIPTRMAPFVLLATLITHLFGGSAGREGTALQMGGSISSLFSKWYRLQQNDKKILLLCGMSAGFGAVFGTPVAGAVFAMEVLAIGKIKYNALLPCFMASLLAHLTCLLYGIHHTTYTIAFVKNAQQGFPFFSFDVWLLCKVAVAGVLFGLTGYLFATLSHFIKNKMVAPVKIKWLVPVVGGLLVISISYAIGTFDYLGLGVSNPHGGVSIITAFTKGGATNFSWFWKLLLTAITLSTGFKGGEVTPLFFIGATLGNVLAAISGAPVDLFAALGFIAVFAGATNTPLACTLMGVELFGGNHIIYYAVACFIAYYFSGHTGIYRSQKLAVAKFNAPPFTIEKEDG